MWAWLRQVCKVPHTRQSADLHAEKKTAGRAAGSGIAASLHHPIIFFLPAATGLELPLLAAGCQSGGGPRLSLEPMTSQLCLGSRDLGRDDITATLV